MTHSPADALYPPAPAGVPADLSRPTAAYRSQAAAMILGLVLFAVFYLALISAIGYGAYWLFKTPPILFSGRGGWFLVAIQYGGAVALSLLTLFLVKGLFKGRKAERTAHVQLKPTDHPELFAFIARVYADAGAPPPRRVYVSPDVNAALIYSTSVVNLVIPPSKDLLLGLGLVNVVTLAEFKAVLAHEFGHFAQRSVGLGTYLYVANRVMHDVIHSRDGLDRFVDGWAAIDLRISFPAWILKGMLWVIRGILSKAYTALNLTHLSLSRQMEYNADAVAVRLTGSDSLLHCLSRLDFASDCLGDAAKSLSAAADHGLQTDDLFAHQTTSADRLRRERKNPLLGVPPALPDDPTQTVQVFPPEDDGVPEKFRSHPTHHQREANAKKLYFRSPTDDRSPWLLFGDTAGMKRDVTAVFYRDMLGRPEKYSPVPATQVQAFIAAEHAETTYDPRYHGLYDDRFVDAGDIDPVPGWAWDADRVRAWLADWPPADLEQRMKDYNRMQGESHLLNGLKSGELVLKGKTFTLRDQQYTAGDVKQLAKSVDDELDAAAKALQKLDRDVFLAHWSLARMLDAGHGGTRTNELLARYQFHHTVQKYLRRLIGEEGRLKWVFETASGEKLDEGTFAAVREALGSVYRAMSDTHADAKRDSTPALTNVPAGTRLFDLLAERSDGPLPDPPGGDSISGEWVGGLSSRLTQMLGRVKRVHFKSLGGLLTFQEKLVLEDKTNPPQVEFLPTES